MKYDDAEWHFLGQFPAGSPNEYGGTHIGLFLRWCFVKGWAGELHIEEEPKDIQRVIEGSLSGTDFLFRYCDGKFTDEDINDEGRAFTDKYYGSDGLYFADYAENFGEQMYLEPEHAHDFAKYSAMLELRLKTGALTKKSVEPS